MRGKPVDVIQDAPWLPYTHQTIGLAMETHNELGPGHREPVYHNAMAAKFEKAGVSFENEPHILITLDDGTVVGGTRPDFTVEQMVIVELKARSHLMTKDDEARIIGYFAALPPVFGGVVHQFRPAAAGISPLAPAQEGPGIPTTKMGQADKVTRRIYNG